MAIAASGCSIGVHSSQARNATHRQTLTPEISGGPLTGTVDESASATELALGILVAKSSVVVEIGAAFGLRRVGFEGATDDLTMVKTPSGRDFYDAYFTSVMVPLSTLDDVTLGVYGRLSYAGLSQLLPGDSATYGLEGGVEVNLPSVTKPNRIFMRVGVLAEGADHELEMANGIGRALGSTSFLGLTATIGTRVMER